MSRQWIVPLLAPLGLVLAAHAEPVRFAPAGPAPGPESVLPASIPASLTRTVMIAPDAKTAAAARPATVAFFTTAFAR